MSLTLGLGGARRHACAAVTDGRQVVGVCEQERITRIRGAGFNSTGVPDEAVDALLTSLGSTRAQVAGCALAEEEGNGEIWPTVRLKHHHAHACAAYLTSPFASATIVICDHERPGISVWRGQGPSVEPVDWPWSGPSLSDMYTDCARLFGFGSEAGDQRFEAFARLMAAAPAATPEFLTTDGSRVIEADGWRAVIATRLQNGTGGIEERAAIAAALQKQVAEVFLQVLSRIAADAPSRHLCLGGSLFYHSSLNTAARRAGLFERVFVPANPGNPGLSVGSAMHVSGIAPTPLSPCLGPSYGPDLIKETLENCKLSYDWLDEGAVVQRAVHHLRQGRLVGWFEGRMEWGPRALGARSILASPFSPHVLENLNRYLKRREAWRSYALSVPAARVADHFTGPAEAPFMECDYRPLDTERFRHVMPSSSAMLRVHTVTEGSPRRFRELLHAFGTETGAPCLVNTSFNGFHEPIVCTPRDAVRVFFGSGLDVLIMDQFILTK